MSGAEKLKWGYTTGACATAATKAALLLLIENVAPQTVSVALPTGKIVAFSIYKSSKNDTSASASVIKNGGDDPDATHGLEISATIELSRKKGIAFKKGHGVGTVTLPGLEIPVGEPAINPVPRRMIENHIAKVLTKHNLQCGVEITISVPKGKEIAKQTFNPRLGIVGGISILGTTGLVKPYSSEAFIASIQKSIAICDANNCQHIVLNSGGRSEKYMKSQLAHFPDYAFVQFGNWVGETLKIIARSNATKITLGMMLGKATKLAEGNLDTHSKKVVFDPLFLKIIAKKSGYPTITCDKIEHLTLARNVTELIPFSQKEPFYKELSRHCIETCKPLLPSCSLDFLLIDNHGSMLSFN